MWHPQQLRYRRITWYKLNSIVTCTVKILFIQLSLFILATSVIMHVTGTIHDTPVVTKTWSNGAHRLYSDPQELISSNFISDANPLSEGFILMNNQKKTSTTNKIYTSSSNKSNNTKTLNSKATALVAYIKPSMNAKMTLSKTLFNASTTTCRPDPLTLKSTLSTLTYQKTTMLTDQLKNEYQLPTVTVTARRIIGEITVQSAYDNTSYTQDKKTLRTNETEQLDVMAEAFRVADPELMPFDSPEDKIADGSGDYTTEYTTDETSPQSTSTSTTSTSTSAPPATEYTTDETSPQSTSTSTSTTSTSTSTTSTSTSTTSISTSAPPACSRCVAVGDCMLSSGNCTANSTGIQHYTCVDGNNNSCENKTCIPTYEPACRVTSYTLTEAQKSKMNPLMRVIPVPLPFRYQFTDVNNPYKVLWVTDKGYLTLGTPFYAIEPVERVEGIPAYIAPFWTHFVNVNETYISATVYNGLVNAPDAVRNVTKRTVERQYKENVNDSTLAFYRVIKLEWKNLITYVDNISNQSDILNLEFSAYLINGLSYNHSYWDSFLRFEYQLSDLQNQSKSPDYQQVLFGYRDGSPNGSYLQTSVSFSQNITEFLNRTKQDDTLTYFLSSKTLSSCEIWYWKERTAIESGGIHLNQAINRNPCPCTYDQALSDFRFYKMNSENEIERKNNVACFVPLSALIEDKNLANGIYQQTCCYDTDQKFILTSGEFAGSVLPDDVLKALRKDVGKPQRIYDRDRCCIPKNSTISWDEWCNLYYELRPPSTCEWYTPPKQAWFGGDPHMQTLNHSRYSCNLEGNFIYAQILNTTDSEKVFSIFAVTSSTNPNIKVQPFQKQSITYYSNFLMELGSQTEVAINVSITNDFLFDIQYIINRSSKFEIPDLTTNFATYFYYPNGSTNSSTPFSIAREDVTISTTEWTLDPNVFDGKGRNISAKIPKLTISTWLGIAMQCYLITHNMACTLLIPKKYENSVKGLVTDGDYPNIDEDYNAACSSQSVSSTPSATTALNRKALMNWFNTGATSKYQSYVKSVCGPNDSDTVYNFCIQDQIVSQSSLISSITLHSARAYKTANDELDRNPPIIQLYDKGFNGEPYTLELNISYSTMNQTEGTNANIRLRIISSANNYTVKIRSNIESPANDCTGSPDKRDYYCFFLYSNATKHNLKITIIVNETDNQRSPKYQVIKLVVNACKNGHVAYNSDRVLSPYVSELFCVCDDLYDDDYCSSQIKCVDMRACKLHFKNNITCKDVEAINNEPPFKCMNDTQNCSNSSSCCEDGYEFYPELQQCVFKAPCNETLCGYGVCQNIEGFDLKYICSCPSKYYFNNITCIEMDDCNSPFENNDSLPCTDFGRRISEDTTGTHNGTINGTCVCVCGSDFVDNGTICVVNDNTTCTDDVCFNSHTNKSFCARRSQVYDNETDTCSSINYCETKSYCMNSSGNRFCDNTTNGYKCNCPPGTILDKNFNCTECAPNTAGPNCALLCTCLFGTCNRTASSENELCNCSEGYTGNFCETVIDYCNITSYGDDVCDISNTTGRICKLVPNNNQRKENQSGFDCDCRNGYTKLDSGLCNDTNECELGNDCALDTTTCVNTIGSYECVCLDGYYKSGEVSDNIRACIDIDECANKQNNCSLYNNSFCVNLIGSFECRCNDGYCPDSDKCETNEILSVKHNETCQLKNKCFAKKIDCGNGFCDNTLEQCYCQSPLILWNITNDRFTCICPQVFDYYDITTNQCVPLPLTFTQFIVIMGCEAISNGTLIRNLIESHLNPTLFKYNYTAVGDGIQVNELQINVLTDGFNFKQLTELFIIMEKFYRELLGICSLDPYFDKPNAGMYISTPICANMNSTKIEGVTSCYLIDQCNRCGNRGVCEPDKNETKCQCFHDPLNPPVGDFCDISTPPGTSVNWPAIVIGILGGIAALLCITTCCLLALALWRRRRHPEIVDLSIRRLWHLPRAKIPVVVTAENVGVYMTSLNERTLSSDDSSDSRTTYRTTYNNDNNIQTVNSEFFRQLEETMSGNMRETVARPDTRAILSSLPTNTTTTSASRNSDPIDDLDDIIDDDDITTIFHDPLDDLFDDEFFEVLNPNLKLPRPQVDIQPTGLFSFLKRSS